MGIKRKWRPEQPIPANPPAVTTKWKLDAADVAALEKQFGAGVIADHTFTLTKGYDNKPYYTVRTDDGAAVKHLIGELKLSEEIAVSGGFDLKSIQRAVAEAKEIGASQQKLLETFKQRYPNGVNVAVIHQAVHDRVPTFLYFDSYATASSRLRDHADSVRWKAHSSCRGTFRFALSKVVLTPIGKGWKARPRLSLGHLFGSGH